jgi:hypothetical protein
LRGALAARLEAGFRQIAHNLGRAGGAPPLFRLVPLGYRLEGYDAQSARVALWNVILVVGPDAAGATATWSTARLALRYTAAGWRLASWGPDTPGPAPALNLPADATAGSVFAAAAPTFRRLTP